MSTDRATPSHCRNPCRGVEKKIGGVLRTLEAGDGLQDLALAFGAGGVDLEHRHLRHGHPGMQDPFCHGLPSLLLSGLARSMRCRRQRRLVPGGSTNTPFGRFSGGWMDKPGSSTPDSTSPIAVSSHWLPANIVSTNSVSNSPVIGDYSADSRTHFTSRSLQWFRSHRACVVDRGHERTLPAVDSLTCLKSSLSMILDRPIADGCP